MAKGTNSTRVWRGWPFAVTRLQWEDVEIPKEVSVLNMSFQAVAVPLFDDGEGGLRVTGTRVLLERIVHAFEDGATPEGIVQSYDTLQLADVYAVLAWYLRQRVEVQEYLRNRAEEAAAIRRTIEAKQPDRAELRARLMARRAQKEVVHAPPGQ